MNNKNRLLIIGVLFYFLISIIVSILNGFDKYIIISNAFIFKTNNKNIIAVNKYPKILKDKEVVYYDKGNSNIGFIHISLDGIIKLYNKDYNKIKANNNLLTSVNNKDLKSIYLKEENINATDEKIINDYLIKNSINHEQNYTYVRKIKIDTEYYLFIVSNNYNDEELLNDSVKRPNDNSYEISFIYKNKKSYTIFEREGRETDNYSLISNVFDYNNDGIYEIAFVSKSSTDHEYLCAEIYYFENDKYESVENCSFAVKQGVD